VRRSLRGRLLAHAAAIALVLATASLARGAAPGCEPIPVTWWSPTGVVGCTVYGEGTASMWGGPGAARNDCQWPWDDCQTISVQSLQTGLVIIVTPSMFCDCYTGTAQERIVDLDPGMVAALGLDPGAGLWPVRVWPVDARSGLIPSGQGAALPDTALGGPK
jgi:hypothetical protein